MKGMRNGCVDVWSAGISRSVSGAAFSLWAKSCGTETFQNAARMAPDGTYRSAREGAVLHVHPSSVMFTRQPATGWVIYHEVVETSKSFMRDLTVVEEEWLVELA